MVTGTFKYQCISCRQWFDAPCADEPITVICPNCGSEYNMQFVPSEKKKLITRLEILNAHTSNQYSVDK
jgi:predicted  nucleic acid-binding Zn-ribbon protein